MKRPATTATEPLITAMQCRAARACLDWSSRKLGTLAGLDATELRRFEAGICLPASQKLQVLRTVIEHAGVVLLFEHGQGVGVRLTAGSEGGAERDPQTRGAGAARPCREGVRRRRAARPQRSAMAELRRAMVVADRMRSEPATACDRRRGTV